MATNDEWRQQAINRMWKYVAVNEVRRYQVVEAAVKPYKCLVLK